MEYLYRGWIVFLFTSALAFEDFVIYGGGQETNGTKSNDKNFSVNCLREHLYDRWNISEVFGKWKVLELYTHLSNEGVHQYNSCPKVTIWETEEFPTTTFGVGLLLFNGVLFFGNEGRARRLQQYHSI